MDASFTPSGLDRMAVRRQFDRRLSTDDAAGFLAREVAARMLERLALVRVNPTRILDVGCGLGQARADLQGRWPTAHYVGLDLAPRRVAQAAAALRRGPAWWPGVRRAPPSAFVAGDAHALPFQSESFELLWSNLALHWFDDRPRALAEWRRVLRPGGVLMFAAWGGDTLIELRRAGVPLPDWPDMHDLGDDLAKAGWADPVTETERLTITWSEVQRMVAEVRAWGGDARRARRAGCATPRQLRTAQEALWAQLCPTPASAPVGLTVELIYGHAWRSDRSRTTPTEAPIRLVRRSG